ncbi:MAG: hypothetical protein WB762_32160 [Candidatus Sulfotelmatobacter sp.]
MRTTRRRLRAFLRNRWRRTIQVFGEDQPLLFRISPDRHWVVYVSDESGQDEIYLTTFPEKREMEGIVQRRISPSLERKCNEIFHLGLTDDFFACPVTPKGSEIDVGTPRHLFHTPLPAIGILLDVSSDGKRLLVNRAEEEAQAPPQLVTNWLAELKK